MIFRTSRGVRINTGSSLSIFQGCKMLQIPWVVKSGFFPFFLGGKTAFPKLIQPQEVWGVGLSHPKTAVGSVVWQRGWWWKWKTWKKPWKFVDEASWNDAWVWKETSKQNRSKAEILEVWELQIWKLVGSERKVLPFRMVCWESFDKNHFFGTFFFEGIWIDSGMKGEQSICNLQWFFLKSHYFTRVLYIPGGYIARFLNH